ncbi:Alpha-N-acetylglucosaminidase [Saliniradius amylolyticus]|uniref:Alpha-N-acetylglucosaminidase n=1 Tax=Saliniradius amylolyticus TaxID=2183582 RepID=A0A2S2E634_9ALTE|nr:DUF5009 domain-containing protein [Saliniradius amylolyticus]AWL13111.1 Alpha-N-acetylglucosaminidase [Saliniradius amylolyticus]
MAWLYRHLEGILAATPGNRLLAVDALRGITITAMILVNNPGSWSYMYWPLKHADWHGWTPTDLIFPFFIFIVGIAITLSFSAQRAKGKNSAQLLKQALVRTIKLLLLGWFLALFYYRVNDPNFSWLEDQLLSIRLPGVLQRIGLVYLATVLIVLNWRWRGQLIWCLGLLLGYWVLMTWVPYADNHGNTFQGLYQFGNSLAAWVDHQLLGPGHVYYSDAQPFSFDPEGLLSTLPAIATCLSGVLIGQYMQGQHSLTDKIRYLLGLGAILVIAGQSLSAVMPINKALWTPSFVVLSSGWACVSLALCLWLIDDRGYRRWCAPFIVFGANAIAFFMFAGVAGRLVIMLPWGEQSLKGAFYQTLLAPHLGNYIGSLAYGILFLLVSYILMYWMYRNHWFWKV